MAYILDLEKEVYMHPDVLSGDIRDRLNGSWGYLSTISSLTLAYTKNNLYALFQQTCVAESLHPFVAGLWGDYTSPEGSLVYPAEELCGAAYMLPSMVLRGTQGTSINPFEANTFVLMKGRVSLSTGNYVLAVFSIQPVTVKISDTFIFSGLQHILNFR